MACRTYRACVAADGHLLCGPCTPRCTRAALLKLANGVNSCLSHCHGSTQHEVKSASWVLAKAVLSLCRPTSVSNQIF